MRNAPWIIVRLAVHEGALHEFALRYVEWGYVARWDAAAQRCES